VLNATALVAAIGLPVRDPMLQSGQVDAITGLFDAAATISPVSWGTEHSFVASSGDLGVSIGTIRPNHPDADGQSNGSPFFTVWRRDGPDAPWRYIAE